MRKSKTYIKGDINNIYLRKESKLILNLNTFLKRFRRDVLKIIKIFKKREEKVKILFLNNDDNNNIRLIFISDLL